MVNRTHYYAILTDIYRHGRVPETRLVDPVLGMTVTFQAAPTPPLAVNVCVRGNVSGAAGIIRQVIDTTTCVLEILPNALPGGFGLPGLAFAQQNSGPLTGETCTFDNGGTAAIGLLANSQFAPGNSQLAGLMHDTDAQSPIPSDFSDTPYFDQHAKVAQSITVDTLAGTSPYFRKGDRCTTASGALTILKVSGSGSTRTLLIIRKTGTITAAQTLTNTTLGGGTTANITVVSADEPLGIWVPYAPTPNLNGLADSYEFPPNANGTGGGDAGLGMEFRLLPLMHAYHQQAAAAPQDRGWRFIPFSSNDSPEGFTDGALGGVTVQVVKCTGTFPASGVFTVGETVTGPGGWSGVVHGVNNSLKYLFVRKTNGATLTAGTVTGATSGATAATNGPVFGWQKGSSHWNTWAAQVATALSRGPSTASQGALFGTAPAYWEGIILAIWQTEIVVHGPAGGAPFPSGPDATEAWVRFITDLRTHVGRADLPITVWADLPTSWASISFFGVPWAYVQREFMRALPAAIERVTVTDSLALGCQLASDSNLWLRSLDYPQILSPAFWRHLRFGQVVVVPGDGFTPLPVGIHLGQSNATGSTPGNIAVAFDSDPDLWPTPSGFPISTVDPNCLSFNQVTKLLEPASIDVNFNGSWGTLQGTSGPEVPVVQRMKFRFADDATASAKFAFFKFTVPGSNVNRNVPFGAGTWDPTLGARPVVNAPSCTVSLFPASGSIPARARFTAAAGTFTEPTFVAGMSVVVKGSLLGTQGAGGNNSAPHTINPVYAIAPDGSWLELHSGTFVVEGPITFQFLAGPPPIWPEVVENWNAFVAQCREHGYVPVPRYVTWDQGDGDLYHVSQYEAALTVLWNAIVALFSLRLKGDEPIAKCVVQVSSQSGWDVPDADLAQLRAIQVSVPTALGNCVVVDPSDLSLDLRAGGNWPRQSRLDNGVHQTGRANITKGFRMDAALATLGPSKGIPPHPKGELAVDADGAVNGGTGEGAPLVGGGGSFAPPADEEEDAGSGASAAAATGSEGIREAINNNPAIAGYTVTKDSRTVQLRTLKDMREELDKQLAEEALQSGFGDTVVDFNT